MADKFLDEAAGGANNGGSGDDAWQTWAAAMAGASADDNVWVRRTTSTAQADHLTPANSGTPSTPIRYIGWPRTAIPNTTITQAEFTNGSATVDNIVGITCARTQHQGRYITAPDGFQYLITQVVDANTVKIDREYTGSTVTGTGGKFQIEANEDYADRPAVAQAAYDADAIDLPIIDFNDGNFRCLANGNTYIIFKNIEFKDSTSSDGILYFNASRAFSVIGCLFKQTTQNDLCLKVRGSSCFIDRTIFEGSGAGSAQRGVYVESGACSLKNSAIYNMGDFGVYLYGSTLKMRNVNIGVEIANGDNDVCVGGSSTPGFAYGVDVSLGGTNGDVICEFNQANTCHIENYQKVLGNHKSWFQGGEYISTAVSGETPNNKLSDTVLKISPNISGHTYSEQDWKVKIPLGEINADAGSQTFKFWIYNGLGVTLNDGDALANFNLAAEYVSSYGDTTAYTMSTIRSAEHTIAVPADADDWDSLSVTPTIAVESKIRLWLEISVYSAAGNLIVDPQVVIT